MLSLKNGLRIAKITQKGHKQQYIYLKLDEDEETDYTIPNPLSLLDKSIFKYANKKMTSEEIKELRESLRMNKTPGNPDLLKIFKKSKELINTKLKREITIKNGEVSAMPLIIEGEEQTENIYVSGQSGAGKTSWSAEWIKEALKIYSDNEFYVFSIIDEDEVIDKLDPIRVILNDDLLDNPFDAEELEDSIILFDDIDTIQNKKLKYGISDLRDWVIEQGRHFGIKTVITAHLFYNYKLTSRLLNEATSIVFFPRKTNLYHVKKYLRNVAGLEKNDIRKMISLKSRYVYFNRGGLTNGVNYVVYEGGCYLLFPTYNKIE
jgi:hypothetical protein